MFNQPFIPTSLIFLSCSNKLFTIFVLPVASSVIVLNIVLLKLSGKICQGGNTMIINVSDYRCPKCKKFYTFETSKEFSTVCEKCGVELKLIANYDMDTEKAKEKTTEMQPEQYFAYINRKPTVTCPYCNSTNTKKISITSKAVNTAMFGILGTKRHKQWHCNKCGSEW